jgi:aerobic-type carbon monoxide dehydrogenase small subunit (CoxS/CutS family)
VRVRRIRPRHDANLSGETAVPDATIMTKPISLIINGRERRAQVEPRTTLLDLVREQFGLTGAKLGCDIQVCGACTLLVNGRPVSACSYLAVDADGRAVTTIEGLGSQDALHPLQEAFMEFGALQCGYCTSGFILTAKALLDECPQPSEQQIRDYLAGNFCRCGCYQEIVQAIMSLSKE